MRLLAASTATPDGAPETGISVTNVCAWEESRLAQDKRTSKSPIRYDINTSRRDGVDTSGQKLRWGNLDLKLRIRVACRNGARYQCSRGGLLTHHKFDAYHRRLAFTLRAVPWSRGILEEVTLMEKKKLEGFKKRLETR